MRALWATFGLNTSFTFAQMLGARAANSLALLGDTGTMAVDSLTYAINLIAEYNRHRLSPRTSMAIEVSASLFSVVALVGVTMYVMHDAIVRLSRPSTGTRVNAGIMLVFTGINLLIDLGMCGSILLRRSGGLGSCLRRVGRRKKLLSPQMGQELLDRQGANSVVSEDVCFRRSGLSVENSAAGALPPAATGTLDPAANKPAGTADVDASLSLNMCSAFAHVLADTMRTLTVMGCGVLVAAFGLDSERTDAIGSLVVCCIILFIAAYITYEALTTLRSSLDEQHRLQSDHRYIGHC